MLIYSHVVRRCSPGRSPCTTGETSARERALDSDGEGLHRQEGRGQVTSSLERQEHTPKEGVRACSRGEQCRGVRLVA